MKASPSRSFRLTSDVLLRAYAIGYFPMAESADAEELFWVEPEARGVFPLDRMTIARSLARTVRTDVYHVVADRDFSGVMRACAQRDKTWINAEILRLYGELHARGHAHSVEVYDGERLVGGLYGVSLNGAFFGESMFHLARDASKVALVHLAARLRLGGFQLLDAQFLTPHLASLGAIEILRDEYKRRLAAAMAGSGDFAAFPPGRAMTGREALALARPNAGDGMDIATMDSANRAETTGGRG